MCAINKLEIVLHVVLCNNCIVSVAPAGCQMATSVTAQRKTGNKHIYITCSWQHYVTTFGCEIRTLRSASRHTRVRFGLFIVMFNYRACQPYIEYKLINLCSLKQRFRCACVVILQHERLNEIERV